ncbi:LysR family transcriptional regulator [Erythrobacter sp. MTPC3]|uniref:LysR family transcriptional regulator n=1 Tax=Erythrobacter sp. MTPC3 TaxID=3056564 RepID=UPI0036F2E61E
MDITTFQTFLAAAATGSFSGAAQRVNASPSSVTERIKQLEYRLGTRLFIRDKRGCQLTPAGEKFMAPARQAVRAWEVARHEVSLPDRFERSLSFGGQYFLWDRLLLGWLDDVRASIPDLALRVTAGAWARLNRDLAEGELDMIVVHDPVFRRDISAERLFEDQLVLVSAGDPTNWKEDFVRIDWGRSLGLEIASRLGIAPETGLVLDLGQRSARWLIANMKSGYMPEYLVAPLLQAGDLSIIEDAPSFDFPAYVCWRDDMDAELAAEVVLSFQENAPELS